MTLDEAFEALHAMRHVDREDFEAGYRAGQEEMRERAAVRMIEVMKQYRNYDFTHLGLGDISMYIGAQEDLANDIRALPID